MPDSRGAGGSRWLAPTDEFLRTFLGLPELALVDESCAAERGLHAALADTPRLAVDAALLAKLADADARANYAVFLAFRDALLGAGTLESYYLGLVKGGRIGVPPLFVDRVAEVIVRHMQPEDASAFERRAGELLHRPQRIAFVDGRVLCGDRDRVELLAETGGFGDIGRLLRESQAPLRGLNLEVLTADNAARYGGAVDRAAWLLDLTHATRNDLGHGLSFTMTPKHSGLKALARVLERWVAHFLDVETTIAPLQRIDDAAWSWHVGLDVESTALLNDLWRGEPLEPERLKCLVGLFRLEFANPDEMRADLAGKPVYLGLAMGEDQTFKLKPQNLLVNLPLAVSM
ncbi:MAG: DUF6352 family protein [Caldimonas sp.]